MILWWGLLFDDEDFASAGGIVPPLPVTAGGEWIMRCRRKGRRR